MYVEPVYEIIYEDQFQVLTRTSSIETCMGSLYTKEEFELLINDGEYVPSTTDKDFPTNTIFLSYGWEGSSYSIRKNRYIKAGNIVCELNKQFAERPKLKVAGGFFEELATTAVLELNWWFKQRGYMFSPAKGGFVKWKPPVVKNVKQKLSKAVLLMLKRRTVDLIIDYLRKTYVLDVYISGTEGEKAYNLIKLGLVHGLDLNYFLTLPRFAYNGNLPEVIKEELKQYKNQEGMEEKTLEAYKEWFNKVYTVEIIK